MAKVTFIKTESESGRVSYYTCNELKIKIINIRASTSDWQAEYDASVSTWLCDLAEPKDNNLMLAIEEALNIFASNLKANGLAQIKQSGELMKHKLLRDYVIESESENKSNGCKSDRIF